jgi:crotonobetainyl-CoA:carnitine CoA-transferase CaiB-like acyl-CoA transferase
VEQDDGRLLAGVRVLDLAKLIPGAAAAGALAALGAEVVKVEQRGGTYLRRVPPLVHGAGIIHCTLDAGKRSVVLDVEHDGAAELLRRLAPRFDVVVESGRPGVMERWGLDGASLADAGVVVLHLSAYGRDGPLAPLPAHGLNLDGVAGLGFSTPAGGVAPGWMPLSVLAGPVFAAQAVAAALYRRARTGRGAELDVSCSEAGLFWQQFLGAPGWNEHVEAWQPLHGPPQARYSVYETADRQRVVFCAIEPRFFAAFCREAGRPDLADAADAGVEFDFAGGDDALRLELEHLFATRTLEEWVGVFLAADVAAGPAYEPVVLDAVPQHRQRAAIRTVVLADGNTVRVPAWPIRVVGAPPPPCVDVPGHTREVLTDLGFRAAEIDALAARGVVE